MKKNRILLIVIAVLILLAIILVTGNRYSTLQEKESAFSVRDTAAVTRIFIADKNVNSVELKRTEKGWIINDEYLANTRLVDILLGTMRRMKVKAPVSNAQHNNVVSRMAAVGKKVEIYQKVFRINLFNRIKLFEHEKRTKVFYVGDATPNNLGTFMLMEGAERPYIVYMPAFRGFLSTRFSPKPDDWLSHVVFNHKLADIQSITLSFNEEPANSFKVDVVDASGNYRLTRLGDKQVVDNYDTLKLLNFLTSFRDLRYESRLNNLLSPAMIDSIVHSPKLYELTLIDRDQKNVQVIMFRKKQVTAEETDLPFELITVDHDRFYGLINEGEDFVLMQYYVFDKVLHPLSYYQK